MRQLLECLIISTFLQLSSHPIILMSFHGHSRSNPLKNKSKMHEESRLETLNYKSIIYINESLFPLVTTSRVHGWDDLAHFLKMLFEVQREAHGEKNSKNCLEYSEKILKVYHWPQLLSG